jgi:hypothetical protein
MAAARKGAESSGASKATGPAKSGARPSLLSAITLLVGPLVIAIAPRAPAVNAASIGPLIRGEVAVDQRPDGRSTSAIAPESDTAA